MSCNDTPAELECATDNDALPLSSTEFTCINTEGEIITLDSRQIPAGTLINYSGYNHYRMEAFRALVTNKNDKPWVLYTNAKLSHEQFAKMMCTRTNLPKIIYWGCDGTWCRNDREVQLADVLYKLSSGACVRVEKLNKSFFLILGEPTYYWLDNRGNYYSEDTFSELCRTHSFEIVDPGHRVYSC